MNVGVGNLVADFLIPCSPARVHDATGETKMEARGLSFTLAQGPRDFQASTAMDLIVRRLIEGRPDFSSK